MTMVGASGRTYTPDSITFESFSSAVLSLGLSNDLAIWRNMWDGGFDLATKALEFMSEHLAAAGR